MSAPIKWYFATNEEGSRNYGGLHARLAVLSALQNTRLRPHLITTGFRNDLTDWMEARGVTLVDAAMPLADAIRRAEAEGRYHTRYLGHWLRCEIPTIEQTDEYVLYTDTDVVFLSDVELPDRLPEYIACAPEFRTSSTNYFNSGVMFLNVDAMRRTRHEFMDYVRRQIDRFGPSLSHNDQYAYNSFYRDVWTPLDPTYNWKPYWGDPSLARILHFHGAKLGAISMLFEFEIPWEDKFWRQIGSLIAASHYGYVRALEATIAAVCAADRHDREFLEALYGKVRSAPLPVPVEAVDFSIFETALSFEPEESFLRKPAGAS